MKRFFTILIATAILVSASLTNVSAEETTHRCTDLPPIAWDSAPTATIRFVFNLALPRVTSAKELYLNALCGAQPAAVWDLVLSGEGGSIEIPRPLAVALDEAVPYMPRVDFVYVRGGGADREVAVFLFANGYDGPLFRLDRSGDDNPWTAAQVGRAAKVWNELPYDVIRRASHWLHDVALFDTEYTANLELLGGLIDIEVFKQTGSRGLALFLGTLFTAKSNTNHALSFWAHEIGHYVDYEMNGIQHFAYAPEDSFQGISKRNNTILGIPVPLWFRLRHDDAIEWLHEHGGCDERRSWTEPPWGFATFYGMCGEMSGEDFADSFVLALGVTQSIRESDYATAPWDEYVEASEWYLPDEYFHPSRLFQRTSGPDASVMARKVDYIYERLKIHSSLPQDADGDGVTWVYGDHTGDCSDINPVDGLCENTGCSDDIDCDDGDACTVNVCREGQCTYTIRDSDGDGSPDAACGGSDCDDADPTIGAGSVRSCTGACNIAGEQQCVAGGWTECSAPTTCDCDPSEPPEVVPCGNCATAERHCQPDGTWAPLTSCEPIDPSADGCFPGETRSTSSGCTDSCGISREREEACNSQCNWEEIGECTLTQSTPAEVCNGSDDDCDGRIDEGCPDALTFVGQAPQPLIEGGGGSFNETNCPSGHALVGFKLHDSSYFWVSNDIIGSVKPLCRSLDLVSTDSGDRYEYDVVTGSTIVPLATHGKHTDFQQTYTCPAGQVVRGIEAYQGWYIDRIKVHCGELEVVGSIGSYGLDRRNGSSSAPMIKGTALNASQVCTGDGVATGLRSKTGDFVDGIGLNCSDVTLQIR